MQGGLCFLFVVQNFASAGKFCGKVRDGVRATLTQRFQFLPVVSGKELLILSPRNWLLEAPRRCAMPWKVLLFHH